MRIKSLDVVSVVLLALGFAWSGMGPAWAADAACTKCKCGEACKCGADCQCVEGACKCPKACKAAACKCGEACKCWADCKCAEGACKCPKIKSGAACDPQKVGGCCVKKAA